MDYQYINPVSQGYKEIKISKEDHNRLFPYRKIKLMDKYRYYLSNNNFIMHRFMSLPAVIFNTILFPISLLMNGIKNYKEVFYELYKMYHQRKCGAFVSDCVSSGSDIFQKILDLIK